MNNLTPTLFFTLSFTFMCTIVNSMELATPLLGGFFLQTQDSTEQSRNNINQNNMEEECSICFLAMNANSTASPLISLHCNHTFHEECMTEWLARSNTCPFCRADFLLHGAIVAGDSMLITQLINAGININEQDYNGNTPLHMATYYQNHTIVNSLLNSGYSLKYCVVKIYNEYRTKAMHIRGANTDIQNKLGQTPLHIAAHFNAASIARLLINNLADIAIKDLAGFTAQRLAEKLHHFEFVQVFPSNKVDTCCTIS